MQDILQNVPETVSDISVNPDGSWSLRDAKTSRHSVISIYDSEELHHFSSVAETISTPCRSSIIDLSSSSDDHDHGYPAGDIPTPKQSLGYIDLSDDDDEMVAVPAQRTEISQIRWKAGTIVVSTYNNESQTTEVQNGTSGVLYGPLNTPGLPMISS